MKVDLMRFFNEFLGSEDVREKKEPGYPYIKGQRGFSFS
jgi:hypothetical protein